MVCIAIFLSKSLHKILTMKNVLLILTGLILLTSCHHITGSGNIVTEKRETGNFKGVSAGGAYEVEIKIGSAVNVEVESDDNFIKYIETKVEDGVLKISTKNRTSFSDGHFKVYVTAPEINSIRSSGAASVKVKDVLKSDGRIMMEASGSADITAEVDAPEVEAEASGASDIALSGRTKNYTASASGSADIKSSNLQTENTDVKASGASSVHVHASVSLKAGASGSASVYYKGGATVQQKTSGAADIKKED